MPVSVLRATAWTVAGAAALTGVVIAGTGQGNPVTTPRLMSGAAWLLSAARGAVTLLDGSTVEPAAEVPVAVTEVFQQGQNAYAVDAATGLVRYVDGATLTARGGVAPIPGATTGLRVFATPDVVYAVDSVSRRIARADPVTLASRGAPQPLDTVTDARNIVLDGSGRLWVLDPATGRLSRVTAAEPMTRPTGIEPGRGVLVRVQDRLVVVDPATTEAATINPKTFKIDSPVRLDGLPAGDQLFTAGSPDHARLYLAGNGMVSVCDLGDHTCRSVPLAGAGARLGTPVEAGGWLFVPSPATGAVFVVDAERATVVGKVQILDGPSGFELIVRDGLVFFNDPGSARAGVIRPDGTVIRAEKYTTPRPTTSPRPTPSTHTPAPDRPIRIQRASQPPGPVPVLFGSVSPSLAISAEPTPSVPVPAVTGSGSPSPTASIEPSPSGPVPVVSSSGSPSPSASAEPPSVAPVGVGSGSVSPIPAPGVRPTVSAPAPVLSGSGSPSRTASAEPSSAWPTLTVQRPAAGQITGSNGIRCGQTCAVHVENGRPVTLTAKALPGYELDHWTGTPCLGQASSCRMTMAGSQTVGAFFRLVAIDLMPRLGQAAWSDSNGPRRYDPRDPEHSAAKTASGSTSGQQAPFTWLEFDTRVAWVQADFTLPMPLKAGDTVEATVVCRGKGVGTPDPRSYTSCATSYQFCAHKPGGNCGTAVPGGADRKAVRKVRMRIRGDDGCTVVRVRGTTRRAPDGINYLYSGLTDLRVVHENSVR